MKRVPISQVIPNPTNPRIIKDDKFKKLTKSIQEFPQMLELRPIVVDSNMVVLGGNMRLKACIAAGLKEVPIIVADNLTEQQQAEFIIKDNVGFGEWDWDLLANQWDVEALEDWGLELPFDNTPVLEAEEDDYEAPSEIQTDIVLGDLIEIGQHRLLCGDSTDSEQVLNLLAGEQVELLFTDPPYNVAFNGRSGKHDVILNDKLSESDFSDFINGFIAIVHILAPKNYYIWCNWNFYGILQGELDYKACIVWAKNVFGLGKGYRHQHEFCLFNGQIDDDIKNESDLWMAKKDTNYMHPTQKPIELAARALKNHKNVRSVVDLFCGSGSTMVAAHQLNRKCYGMELDPKYCQVIIDRMHKLDSSLDIKINGKPYGQN
jgi:DNA modification methylase